MMRLKEGLEIFRGVTVFSEGKMIIEGVNNSVVDSRDSGGAKDLESGKFVSGNRGGGMGIQGEGIVENVAGLGGRRTFSGLFGGCWTRCFDWLFETKKPAARKGLEFDVFLLANFSDELMKFIHTLDYYN